MNDDVRLPTLGETLTRLKVNNKKKIKPTVTLRNKGKSKKNDDSSSDGDDNNNIINIDNIDNEENDNFDNSLIIEERDDDLQIIEK
jgi:hypothetical protein